VRDTASAFLYFGYLPRMEEGLNRQLVETRARAQALSLADLSMHELTELGAKSLAEAFDDLGGGDHVIPLSGGLDSRAILGALLAAGLRDRIVTVTMGTPGTLDYEIGRRVANAAGVAHETIDLTSVELDAAALESVVAESGASSWVFDLLFHRLIPRRFGRGPTYWSGFMGAELAGSHKPDNALTSWSDAVADFVAHNRFCGFAGLARPGFDPEAFLPGEPPFEAAALSYADQLDFGIRQERYIRPTVIVDGYRYRTPFLHPSWAGFILGVPNEMRSEEHLYQQVLRAAFPDLCRLPTKNTLGLPVGTPKWIVTARRRSLKAAAALKARPLRRGLRRRGFSPPFPLLNYIDFAAGLNRRPDLKELVFEAISALDRRGIADWVSGVDLWKRQQGSRGDFDLACALTLLASLELNLRADERRASPLFQA